MKALPAPDGMVSVRAVAHPFEVAAADYVMPEGLSVADMVARLQPSPALRRNGHVFIGDQYVDLSAWDEVKPQAGDVVVVRLVPAGGRGGGKKNPLRTIVSIAVLAVGAALPVIAPSLMAGIGGTLIKAGIGIVGSLLSNAIAPPAKQKMTDLSYQSVKDSPTLFIEGARNQARPFSPIPVILGRHRRVPDLGADTYTETIGDAQYVRQLFVWGYGPIALSDLKIGETPIENFSDVEMEHYLTGAQPSSVGLYPGIVDQQDYAILMSNAAGWQVRTGALETNEIIVDITFDRGLVSFNDQGHRNSLSVQYEIGYSPAGENDWTDQVYTLTLAQTSAVRRSYRFPVDSGQYDVRMRRISGDRTSDQLFDTFYWTALRSVKYSSPILAPGLAFTVLRMKATDQINGTVDQFNGVCEALIPDWDLEVGAWITRATSNPASLYRYVAQGRANKRALPDARINLAALEDWHEKCVARGLSYNAVIDYESRVGEMLDEIVAAGRARRTLMDGKLSVIIDEEKPVPVQHFTQRNSWGYQGEISYPKIPHGFRCQFVNAQKGWQQDERIVCADGYNKNNATDTETLEMPGVTDPDAVYILAREHLATLILRPEIHSFYADVEHLVCTRGDPIRFTHDVPLVGLGAARVVSVEGDAGDPENAVSVTFDNDFEMEAGKIYSVRFRLTHGETLVKIVNTVPGTTRTLVFSAPFPMADAPAAGDLTMFGEYGRESLDLIILSIDPGPDYTARIRAVNAAPAIFNAATGVIPPHDSLLTVPSSMMRPLAPIIRSIQSDEKAIVRNIDGTFHTRMIIALDNLNAIPVRPIIKIRRSGTMDYEYAQPASATAELIVLTGLDDNTYYDLEIRYAALNPVNALASNIISAPLVEANVLFTGESGRPDDVENLRIQIANNLAILTWDPVGNVDFSYYEIRFVARTTAPLWNAGQTVLSNIRDTRVPVLVQFGTYMIKAFDRMGNESLHAAVVATSAEEIIAYNVVEFLAESPAFAGKKTNCEIDGGVLQLIDAAEMLGIYEFENAIDLGDIYTCRVTLDIEANGENPANTMDKWTSLAALESLAGSTPGNWRTTLQIRVTNDDPDAAPVWSEWGDFLVGDYSFRAAEFRLLLESRDGHTTPNVTRLSVGIDMPDRLEGIEDVVVGAGGLSITYSPAFKAKPVIAVTGKNFQTGDYIRFTDDDRTGFTITIYDSTDAPVARTVDWITKGYGRELSA